MESVIVELEIVIEEAEVSKGGKKLGKGRNQMQCGIRLPGMKI